MYEYSNSCIPGHGQVKTLLLPLLLPAGSGRIAQCPQGLKFKVWKTKNLMQLTGALH